MRLRLKEDPKEWRKATWLSALGFALLASILRWRHVLSQPVWLTVLAVLVLIALSAWLRPSGFRGWYRLSQRINHTLLEILGRIVLTLFFWIVLTPIALVMRLTGKDPLRLKRPTNATTYWTESRESTPLDSIF